MKKIIIPFASKKTLYFVLLFVCLFFISIDSYAQSTGAETYDLSTSSAVSNATSVVISAVLQEDTESSSYDAVSGASLVYNPDATGAGANRNVDEIVNNISSYADNYLVLIWNGEFLALLQEYTECEHTEENMLALKMKWQELINLYADEIYGEGRKANILQESYDYLSIEVDEALKPFYRISENFENNATNLIAQNYGITPSQFDEILALNFANTSLAEMFNISSYEEFIGILSDMVTDMNISSQLIDAATEYINAQRDLEIQKYHRIAENVIRDIDYNGNYAPQIWDFFFEPSVTIMCTAYSLADDAINGTTYRVFSCWQEAADMIATYVLEDYGPDLETFYNYFGIETSPEWLVRGRNYNTYGYMSTDDNFITLFQTIGYVVATLLFAWHVFCMLFGPLTRQQDTPFKLIARYGITLFVIYNSQHIVGLLGVIAKGLWKYVASLEFGDYSMLSGYFAPWELTSNIPCSGFLRVIICIALGWNVVKGFMKLFIEIIERYTIYGVMCIFFPFAASANVTSNTSDVFKAFLQMFISQLFILVMNLWFVRMFFRLIAYRTTDSTDWMASIIFFLFVITFLRVARRLDEYMMEMGMSVALAGTNLITTITSVAQTTLSMGSGVFGASGKIMSKTGKTAMSLGSKTNLKGMYAAGYSISSLGSVLNPKNGVTQTKGDISAKLLTTQAINGQNINMPFNNSMWRSSANGTLKNSSALSSDSINAALATYMSPQFLAGNPSMRGLHATASGSCISGISSIPLGGNRSKDIEFRLTRERTPNSLPHYDIMGNTWYQQYKNPKLSLGESVSVHSPSFEILTGISPNELVERNPQYDLSDFNEVLQESDGMHITDDHENVIAKKLNDDTWCWSTDDEADEMLEILSYKDFGKTSDSRYKIDINDKSEDETCWLESQGDHLVLGGWDSKGQEVRYHLYDLSRSDVNAERFPKSKRLMSNNPIYPSFGYIKHKAR